MNLPDPEQILNAYIKNITKQIALQETVPEKTKNNPSS